MCECVCACVCARVRGAGLATWIQPLSKRDCAAGPCGADASPLPCGSALLPVPQHGFCFSWPWGKPSGVPASRAVWKRLWKVQPASEGPML